jgi:hypothetical protein
MKEEAEDGKMWMEEEYKGNRKHWQRERITEGKREMTVRKVERRKESDRGSTEGIKKEGWIGAIKKVKNRSENEGKRNTESGHVLSPHTTAVKRIFNIAFNKDTALVYTF